MAECHYPITHGDCLGLDGEQPSRKSTTGVRIVSHLLPHRHKMETVGQLHSVETSQWKTSDNSTFRLHCFLYTGKGRNLFRLEKADGISCTGFAGDDSED